MVTKFARVTLPLVGLVAALALSACSTPTARPQALGAGDSVVVDVTADVAYADDGDPMHRLDVCRPADHTEVLPAVILIHGGSWQRGDKATASMRDLCRTLASGGFVTFNVDYRLVPSVHYPVPDDDVQTALDWIFEHAGQYGGDPARVGAVGASAGGHLAALLAVGPDASADPTTRVKALVDLSGIVDLRPQGQVRGQAATLARIDEEFLDCRSLASCPTAAEASPITHVDPSDPPAFIVHSAHDYVPAAQGKEFAAALQKAGVPATFVEQSGDAHATQLLSRDPSLAARIVEFLHSHLG